MGTKYSRRRLGYRKLDIKSLRRIAPIGKNIFLDRFLFIAGRLFPDIMDGDCNSASQDGKADDTADNDDDLVGWKACRGRVVLAIKCSHLLNAEKPSKTIVGVSCSRGFGGGVTLGAKLRQLSHLLEGLGDSLSADDSCDLVWDFVRWGVSIIDTAPGDVRHV